ncbi:MAG: hypothetical protein LQ343_004150 [Gyalolechia ehrenbergii]|nr:MAG: hypothetical protein LQ343_004150 [Gyalolechia ehrenbergii]
MDSRATTQLIPTHLLCQEPGCPIKDDAHPVGGYQTNPYDRKQRDLPEPPKAIITAMSKIDWHGAENVAAKDLELMERWNEVHGGWMNVPVKKQSPRKGRGKTPERNWQAARQNGPKPMIIGSGRKMGSLSPVQKPVASMPKVVANTEKEMSFGNALSSSGDKKIAWDEDV